MMGGGAVVVAILLGAMAAYGYHLTAGSRLIIPDYLRTHSVRKLQIGAGGTNLSGWLNTDIDPAPGEAYLDATKPFPIPDGALAYIFSEHLFEHLSYSDGLAMLRQCHRTLHTGGKLRIATPNLLTLVQLFRDSKTDEMRSYINSKLGADYWPEPLPQTVSPECVILNYELRSWGHRFVYDPRTLRESLERAGFQSIRQLAPGESEDPQLAGMEVRHKAPAHVVSDYETMVFEAVRP